MNTTALADDALALVLTCSHLALKSGEELTPLSLSEWNVLSSKIQNSQLKTPGRMLGAPAGILQSELGLSANEAARLAMLLERGSAAAFALENLNSAGIHIVTRVDSHYPQRLRERLKVHAPIVLFYSGKLDLASQRGIAIVGSRAVDADGEEFASELAGLCAQNKLNVVSGAAKGVDTVAMSAAIKNGGTCIGILSDSLARKVRDQETRQAIFDERLLLLSPFHPNAGFHVANAMSRNKCIYTLADYAVVIASDFEKGGTWAGATENLRKSYVPLFVRINDGVSKGNRELLERGAIALEAPDLKSGDGALMELFASKTNSKTEVSLDPQQLKLG